MAKKKKEVASPISFWKDRIKAWLKEHNRDLMERGKTLLIVLLFCSAFVLAGKTGVLGDEGLTAITVGVVDWFDGGTAGSNVSNAREYAAGARPQVMAVSPEAGTRYGAMYSSDVDTLYARFSTYLGEALGTAGTPESVSRSTWERALSQRGVYFDFIVPESLVCLAAWQGTSVSDSAASYSARKLCLSVEGKTVCLYYISAQDGNVYRCSTALEESAVTSRMSVYQPNGAYFVFEREGNAALDPDVLILPGASEVRSVSVSGGSAPEDTETLMRQFGMNEITASSYLEASGTTVYLDGDSTLRIAEDGTIHYECGTPAAGENSLGGTMGLPEIVDELYRMTQECIGFASQAGELRLVSAAYDDRQDTHTVRFAYFLDGMQVCDGAGEAASFTFTSGVLTQAQMRPRLYEFTGETQTPLPSVQAAALAAAAGGTDPVRVYQDTGDRVTVSWRIG